MARFGHVTRLAMVRALSACMGALFLASPPALAQGKAKEQASTSAPADPGPAKVIDINQHRHAGD